MRSFSDPAALFRHRWSVPILAELYRTDGSRFVVLVNRLGISPDSLRHTLKALIDAGWVRRNPGYGHPLRPEYVLTPSGTVLAPACTHLAKMLRTMEIEEIGLRKWSMPVVAGLRAGNERFSDLKSSLTGITARALTLALKDLQAAGLANRTVLNLYPPTTRYRLTVDGRRLGRALAELWGRERRDGRPVRHRPWVRTGVALVPA